MRSIKQIILEEILNTTATYPEFGERLLNLHEVGEAQGESYPYTFDDVSYDEVHYDFDTEKNEYEVIMELENSANRVWNVQFGVVGGTPRTVTNEFRISRVMPTVIKIVNDFINRYKPNILKFAPAKEDESDVRRQNLYMAYIKKNMRPDYFVYEMSPYIIIERKAKITDKNVVR